MQYFQTAFLRTHQLFEAFYSPVLFQKLDKNNISQSVVSLEYSEKTKPIQQSKA